MKLFKLGILSVLMTAMLILSGCSGESEIKEVEVPVIKEVEKTVTVEVPGPNKVKITTTTKKVTVKSDTINYNLSDSVALATAWEDSVNKPYNASGSYNSVRAAGTTSDKFAKAGRSLKKINEAGVEEDVISVKPLTEDEQIQIKTGLKQIDTTNENVNEAIKDFLIGEGYETKVTEEVTTSFVELKEGQTLEDIQTEIIKIEEEPVVIELKEGFEMQPVRQVFQSPYTDIYDEAKGIYIAYANYSEWKYTDESDAIFGSLVYVKNDGTSADIFVNSKEYNNPKLVPAFYMKSSDDEDYLQFDQAGNMFVAANDEHGKVSIYKYEPIGGTLTKVVPEINGLSIRNYRVSEDGKWLFLNAMVNGANNVFAIPTFRPEDYIELYKNDAQEWSVENVVVTNDRTVYFFVNDYAGGRRTSGLYKCKFDYANNTYSKDNIEKEITLPMWAFLEDLDNDYGRKTGSIDYEGLLNFIFSFCGDSSLKKEFRLDKAFEEYSEEKGLYDWYYGRLYTTKKDIDALKFIFEDAELAQIFQNYCYDDSRKDDGTYKGGKGRFPFERFVFIKDTNDTAYTVSPAYYNTWFGSTDTTGGILLTNNEGVFVLKPNNWDENINWFDCSTVVKVIDNNGNYVFEIPEALKHFECPAPRKDYVSVDPTQSEWFKKPFQTNKNGIFMYNKDSTQIWYYSNGVALNLLANDDASISEITSFYSDDDSVSFIARYGDSKFTHKIDLATRSLKEYKFSGNLTQVMEINNSIFKPKSSTDIAVSVKFQRIEDLTVTVSEPRDGKIFLTAAKKYNEDGFDENFSNYKWTCLEKVLNTKSDGSVNGGAYFIEIETEQFQNGSYPILVTAQKANGTYCSCFFYLIIE